MKYSIRVGTRKFEVEVGEVSEGLARVTVDDVPYEVAVENFAAPAPSPAAAPAPAAEARPSAAPTATALSAAGPRTGAGAVVALIPGRIIEVRVAIGDTVAHGQVVAIMEAMKMENEVTATASGTVREIRVRKDAEVATGDVLMVIG